MAENAEAERHISQAMLAALSVALGIGMQIQHQRAAAARRALAESEDRQKELAAQLAAERETAAVLWSKIDDREWVRAHPQQVAEAWASARAWEQVDTRAAEARARFDTLLGALYDVRNPLIDAARDAEDYQALALLLQRAVDVDPELEGTTRFYEEVPERERRAWLERQVWGPDSAEGDRIARSAELADVQAGLPVAVLREMSEETRAAWLELQAMSQQERYAWRRTWLEQQVWGPASDPATREARARALQELIASSPETPVDFTSEEWNAFVNEYRDRLREAAPAEGSGSAEAGAEQAAEPVAEGAQAEPGAEQESAAPSVPETRAARLERARAAVREAWPAEVADAVVGTPAFSALAHSLHQLEERGYAMTDILGKISPEGLVGLGRYGDPVRDSAALAQYHVKQLAKSLPPRAEAEAGLEKLEQYVAEHQTSAANEEPAAPPADAARGLEVPEQEAPGTTSGRAGSSVESAGPTGRTPEGGEQARRDTAVEAIRAVWSQDADWIVGSQTRSVTRLADALEEARRLGHDPIEFMREAVIASGKERVIQPNRAVGEAVNPETTTTYEPGIPHPGVPGADPAAFAAAQVRKHLHRRKGTAGQQPKAVDQVTPADGRDVAVPASNADQEVEHVETAQPREVVEAVALAEEGARPSTPPSPWSRAGADQRGLGGDPARLAEAAVEEALAAQDHARAEQVRGEPGEALDVDDEPSPAAAGETEAAKLDDAAGEHEKVAESLRNGAYEQGGEAAQLAGESYPRDIKSSLAKGGAKGNKQGKAPAARRWRLKHSERGR